MKKFINFVIFITIIFILLIMVTSWGKSQEEKTFMSSCTQTLSDEECKVKLEEVRAQDKQASEDQLREKNRLRGILRSIP